MSLKQRFSEPGFVVSALVHVGALAATLVAFSQTEKFDDFQETVPVEVVTDNQFNQIMKGDKSAKAVRPDAVANTEQAAPQSVAQPETPTPPKVQSAPPPPPPPMPPVRQVEQPKPPAPPPPVAVLPPPRPEPPPPPRPEPPAPTPPPPAPMPPVRDVQAEPVAPKPEPKPEPKPIPKPVARPVPPPPPVPHPPVAARLPEPKPAPKPRPAEKPRLDQLAKLMQDLPTETTPAPRPAVSKPRDAPPPATTASESNHFDLTDISKLLSGSAPAQRASTSHEPSRVASLGSPTASAPKMSPSFWAGLDGVMEEQYRQCWSYLGLNSGVKYVPQVRVVYSSSGALEGEPVLINPPSDPALRSLAESALRAVRRCNPLRIPDQYAPYYNEWRGRVLRFDPQEMAG